MKAFAIFPTICIFVMVLTILRILGFPSTWLKKILFSFLAAGLFAVFVIINSSNFFEFLYFFNFVSVLIIVPCLTYLANVSIHGFLDKAYLIRLFVLFVLSAIFTLLVFGILFFMSMANNPMDYVRHLNINTNLTM